MELGLFMMPIHPPGRDYQTVLREDQEAVVLADRLGYSEVWIGEHFSSKSEQITSPLMFLASLIDRTDQIKFGTGVVNLPQHHPAVVAAHAAMFDHLSGGRLLFGIGTGGLPSDFELFQRGPKERPAMMREAIEIILTLWTTDPPYDIKGDYWDISLSDVVIPDLGVGQMAKPLQQPHPPIAVSILSPNSGSAREAGARGWLAISANFVPAHIVKTHWQAYAEGAEAAGIAPDPANWHVARSILVCESDAEAEDYLADPDNAFRYYFKYLLTLLRLGRGAALFKSDPALSDDEVTPEHAIDGMVIAGSAKTVTEKLAAFQEDIGPFGTLIATAHDWDRPEMWKTSMRLLAEEVVGALG